MDINCDLGEGIGHDEEIMPFITSANIACGGHAGDEESMLLTLRLAKKYGLKAGAHPSWPDPHHFGRVEMHLPLDEVEQLIFKQIKQLAGLAKTFGFSLHHVKPHGALYNQAATDAALAEAVAKAVKTFSQELILVGLAGSGLPAAGSSIGLTVFHEGFPDRAYLPNGQLMPRSQAGAVIYDPVLVAEQAKRLAREGIAFNGKAVSVDTLCLHGDNPCAVENARQVQKVLQTT